MTNEPAPETTAKLAAATEDSSATASPPSDWPDFARALEIQRNAARAERDELNRQLSVALKGKRPYSSAFADETIASQVKRIAELEEKLNGWFSERNAARAERDAKQSQLKEVNSWLDECVKQRDTANALSLSLCADRDGDAKDRDDEIAVLRADVARLSTALEGIAEYGKLCNPGTATDCARLIYLAKQALAK
jgi:hypothetical protein